MWEAPDGVVPPEPRFAASGAAVPAAAVGTLSLGDVVDLALRNNPATRLSWAQARAAADVYGVTRGQLLPSLSLDATASRTRALAQPGRPAGERTLYGPSVSLSYLVLDFGGRSGSIAAARNAAVAADFSHNVVIQNTILTVEASLFSYLATRALRDAQRSAVEEAAASLRAAEERHRVGLATIADVLQARTARSQQQLQLDALEGGLLTSRGALAVAMGVPANASFDIPDVPPTDSVHFVTASVDSLIEYAVRARPDLAAARAQAAAATNQLRVAKSAGLPALTMGATSGYTGSNVPTFSGRTYALTFGIQLPLFTGFSREYDVQASAEELEAATARAAVTRQQVVFQVFSAYYGLQTATQRVHTSADLLASATESESVARGRYREGVGTFVDLLIAQTALANARAQEVQARWEWRTALAQLAHDVGVLGIRGEPLAPIAPGASRGTR